MFASTAPSQVPDSVLNDARLNAAIGLLPSNYNFEIHKTIHRIRTEHANIVALQFPEGASLDASIVCFSLTRPNRASSLFVYYFGHHY